MSTPPNWHRLSFDSQTEAEHSAVLPRSPDELRNSVVLAYTLHYTTPPTGGPYLAARDLAVPQTLTSPVRLSVLWIVSACLPL